MNFWVFKRVFFHGFYYDRWSLLLLRLTLLTFTLILFLNFLLYLLILLEFLFQPFFRLRKVNFFFLFLRLLLRNDFCNNRLNKFRSKCGENLILASSRFECLLDFFFSLQKFLRADRFFESFFSNEGNQWFCLGDYNLIENLAEGFLAVGVFLFLDWVSHHFLAFLNYYAFYHLLWKWLVEVLLVHS